MDLQNIVIFLDDEELAIILLPPSYKYFRETLLYGRDTLCSENVKKAFTQKDLIDSRFEQNLSIDFNDALFIKKSSRNKRGMTCNYCWKKVHLKKLKSKQYHECKYKGTSSVEASYVREEYDVGALVLTSEYKGVDSWVLDSRCSSHMKF